MQTPNYWLSLSLEQLHLILLLGSILGAGLFVSLLLKIRFTLWEKLIALFNPFFWVFMFTLNWVMREPKRYKAARKAKNH